MAFSEFTRNFELIELNHNPNDFYKFENAPTDLFFKTIRKNKRKHGT